MKLDRNTPMPETLVQEVKIPIEYKKVDDFVPKIDGGKIFRRDRNSGLVELVELTHNDNYVLGGVNNSRLELEPGSDYVEAINLRNATKKFNQSRYDFQTK